MAREAAVSTKHQELLDREAGIVAESENVRQSLERFREDLRIREGLIVQRGVELDARGAELRKREEQVEHIKKDQSAQREHLESRESKVTQDEAFYQKRLVQTNENLCKKEEKMAEESATKEKLFRDSCRKDFAEKAKKQEERFMKRRNELEARIRKLEAQKKRFDSRLQVAVEDRTRGAGPCFLDIGHD